MGKGEELTTTKYLIHAQITANGIVEKPDVVGAVFGQTEGLLSNDLDLRELQRTGRIGRIQVNIHSNSGRAKGEIVIPSSLDRVETAILADVKDSSTASVIVALGAEAAATVQTHADAAVFDLKGVSVQMSCRNDVHVTALHHGGKQTGIEDAALEAFVMYALEFGFLGIIDTGVHLVRGYVHDGQRAHKMTFLRFQLLGGVPVPHQLLKADDVPLAEAFGSVGNQQVIGGHTGTNFRILVHGVKCVDTVSNAIGIVR